MIKIPDKTRKEWVSLLNGEINAPLKNFFFQMKVTQTKDLLNDGKVDMNEAVEDIYNLCVKFSKAKNMEDDIKAIFGTNIMPNESEMRTQKSENKSVVEEKKLPANEDKEVVVEKKVSQNNDFSSFNNEELNAKLEQIKQEAQKRIQEAERKRLELEAKLKKERDLRKQREELAKAEKIKRILEAERKAKSIVVNEKGEKISFHKKKEGAEKKVLEPKKKIVKKKKLKPKKKTFFQRFFGIN